MAEQKKSVIILPKEEIPRAGVLLTDAFREDPVWKAVFHGAEDREERLNAFYQTPLRYSYKYGEVYASSENLEGVAAWVPGRYAEMTFWRMLASGAVKSGFGMGMKFAKKLDQIFKRLKTDRMEIMEGRDFLYLQIIGVAHEFQGKGFGGRLLKALIEKSEEAALPIYLETETEENVEMYKRFGFRLAKQITLPIVDLPMWEMVRETGG